MYHTAHIHASGDHDRHMFIKCWDGGEYRCRICAMEDAISEAVDSLERGEWESALARLLEEWPADQQYVDDWNTIGPL